jgi:RHS repeat-associated protein
MIHILSYSSNSNAAVSLRDSFTGKEDQGPDFSVPYTDFGARHYGTALQRWLVPDPLGEKYYDVSPYVYCANNPVQYIDPTGQDWFQNTRTGELYFDPKYTKEDLGRGYMKGDNDWMYLAENGSFSISDDDLVHNYSSSTIGEGFVFDKQSAISAMKKVGFASRPLKAKVEVIRITENHPEGLNQISFQREEERILSVERTVFVESNLEQSIEKELFVSYDIHGAPFPANIVIERMQGTRTYSYSKKSKDTQPLKELLLVLLKTIAETW